LAEFDYDKSRRKRGRRKAIAEIVVNDTVPDVTDLIVLAERWIGGDPSSVIWQATVGTAP